MVRTSYGDVGGSLVAPSLTSGEVETSTTGTDASSGSPTPTAVAETLTPPPSGGATVSADGRPRVYQAGPINDVSSAAASSWRDELKATYDRFEWVDPLDHQDFSDVDTVPTSVVEADIEAFSQCNAMYVRRIPNTETWGTPMEVVLGGLFLNLPVVIHNTGDSEVSPWARRYSDFVAQDRVGAVEWLTEQFEDVTR